MQQPDPCFIPFRVDIDPGLIPAQLNNPFDINTPEIAGIAAHELQQKLSNSTSLLKGKMFGVLVTRDSKNQLGYLIAFSGKITTEIPDLGFVPSVFDDCTNQQFLHTGMRELTEISRHIKVLENISLGKTEEIEALKNFRKEKSIALQQELFSKYQFLNHKKEKTSLLAIFSKTNHPDPPSAAGDCAAPKLLHYAFKHDLKPIAIAEFWWGPSPRSLVRKHGEFYPACEDKCRPILDFMLG